MPSGGATPSPRNTSEGGWEMVRIKFRLDPWIPRAFVLDGELDDAALLGAIHYCGLMLATGNIAPLTVERGREISGLEKQLKDKFTDAEAAARDMRFLAEQALQGAASYAIRDALFRVIRKLVLDAFSVVLGRAGMDRTERRSIMIALKNTILNLRHISLPESYPHVVEVPTLVRKHGQRGVSVRRFTDRPGEPLPEKKFRPAKLSAHQRSEIRREIEKEEVKLNRMGGRRVRIKDVFTRVAANHADDGLDLTASKLERIYYPPRPRNRRK